MIFGIGTALCWGFADLFAAMASRRTGWLRTLILAQVASVVALVPIVIAFAPTDGANPTNISILLATGALLAIAYAAFFRALEIGPLGLVSPIAACYAAVVVLLSLAFLGERLSLLLMTGAIATIAGVAVMSGHSSRTRSIGRSGVFFALVAMIGFGLGFYAIGAYSKDLGWGSPVLVVRIGTVVALVLWAIQQRAPGRPTDSIIVLPLFVGVLDALGMMAYGRGSEVGLLTAVAVASATYPIVPVLGGLAIYKERMSLRQIIGVVLALTGLAVLGIAQS